MPDPARTPELIPIPEWLARTGLRLGAVRGAMRRGELVPIRVGRCMYLRRAEAESWLAGCSRPYSQPVPPLAA